MSESGLGLFGYGSLVLPESASMTLGRPVGELRPAQLHDWKRRFSQRRDNLTCEKTFECDGGRRPEWILGLNVEAGEDDAGAVNGVVIELSEAELDAARGRIEAVLGRLAAGRFEVTHRPHRSLCLDCPARERLCSHGPAETMRESPDPPIEEGEGDPQLSLLEEQ